ncbi:pyruvate dehydrogenase complex dihydrolipoyllysine-residue acetyltransferase [Agarivorans sp. 1_MG-2023]|uniref:pyruvate dehydrogenase complex dihydrolipoyllysine-residue acetyltransferase n=1 Tax=Agarivorans sp. 1_MG-2023 TaxID=3062634 RepID=UPI0026E12551|nr:pyruvate dehydrogenase complex dihydrolipoyllysine-residue acetyltransferase [Agarivorans sp. 1_MG-2023]MDO6764531.1 pyruvate dehydrogenase complex dihydrolipoyllysine-residue acetyltransferase [Agarivorans sp. 1_MG-2023]
MSIEIFVPDIGDDEVEVTEILVNVGDSVELEQSLISVEGDKAAMEVPASQAGVVKEIKVAVGDSVATNALIMIFEAEGAAAATPAAEAPVASATPAASSVELVHVPDIGDDEVEITEIAVSVGDVIDAEQTLISVEGDKAAMEVPAPFVGTVKAISVAVGDKVTTGSLIMEFEVAGSAPASAPVAEAAPAAPAAKQEQQVLIPDIGDDEVEVTEVTVSVGDTVELEQTLISVEGDKAAMEVPAPFAGVVKELKVTTGDKVKTGSLIMVFEVTSAAPVASAPAAAPAEAAKPPAAAPAPAKTASAPAKAGEFVENSAYVHASPVIRRLAREFGVDLAKVKASGRKGRIVKEDVQAYVKQAVKVLESGASAGGAGMAVAAWPSIDYSKFGEVEEVPLSRIQKISGPALHRNWVKIPHVTQFDEADISEMEAFRKEQNVIAEKQQLGFKITPLVFMLKAAAKTLEAMPKFNSALSDDGNSLIMKKYIHIGIAVDTPNGLVVPVVRDVNKKGVYQLSEELVEISKKARAGKLTASDMQGGCFTISSLGGIGGTQFTPIVNAPEVAILGVSRSEMKPKWNGKDFVPKLMLPLALSYDHRVIDGADGARFISTLSGLLGDIRRLVL